MSVGSDTAKEIQGLRLELQTRAAQFLTIVQAVEIIFSPYCLSNDRGVLDAEFFSDYKSYCAAFQDNAAQIIDLEHEETNKELSSDVYRIDELAEAEKRFTNRMLIFFESSDESIRKAILDSLVLSIKSEENNNVKKFLKKLYQQLNGYQLLEQADREYNPKIDILLELYFIGEIIYGGMKLFPLLPKKHFPTSRFGSILDTGKRMVKTNTRRSISFIGAKEQLIELADAQNNLSPDNAIVLSEDDIYAAIKIDETLFLQRKQDEEIIKKFEELYRNENANLARLTAISEELPLVVNHLSLNQLELECIDRFLLRLKSFLSVQQELCQRLERNGGIITHISELNDKSEVLIGCFLDIYEEGCLHEQSKISEFLMRDLKEIDKVLKKNEKKCEEIRKHLPTIAVSFSYALAVNFFQIPQRRKMHAESILRGLSFNIPNKLENIERCYREMAYILVRDSLYEDLKKNGYIRPQGLRELVESLKINADNSVGNILIREEPDDILKSHFLLYVQKNNNMAQKLKFFQEIYALIDPRRAAPLRLEELMRLRHYFNENNLLNLSPDTLKVVNEAFHLKEQYSETAIKHIITVLMPILRSVHHDLEEILREFQLSYDIIEILLDVPEVKEKLNGKKVIWALNRRDIQSLSPFWREIFINENSALRKFLRKKKNKLISSRDIPSEFVVTIGMLLNVDTKHKRKQNNSESSQHERIKDELQAQMDAIGSEVCKNYKEMSQVIDPIVRMLIQEEFYKLVRLFSEDGTLHQYFIEQLVAAQHEIFEIVFNAFKRTKNYEELIELFNDDPSNQHFIGGGSQKMMPKTPQNVVGSQEFYAKIQEGLSGPIREKLYQKIKSIENESAIALRDSVALILLKKEFYRQVKFLKSENIFSDAVLMQLVRKENEILIPVLHRILKKKKPEFFMGGYARALLEMPYYLVEALSNSFSEHMLETRTVFSSEFILRLSQSNVALDLSSFQELIKVLQKEYSIKNKKLLCRIESQISTFRLLNMVRNKSDNQIYYHLGNRICELRDNKPKKKRRAISLIPETPVKQKSGKDNRPNALSIGAIDKIFKEESCTESGNEGVQSVDLFSVPKRTIQRQKVNFSLQETQNEKNKSRDLFNSSLKNEENLPRQKLISNLKKEIDLHSNKDWHFEESFHMTKVYDRQTLVFTAAENKAASKSYVSYEAVSSLSVEDVYVEVHRHNDADVAKAVNAMAKTTQTMKKPKLEIEVVSSANHPAKIVVQYIRYALEKKLFPEVIFNGEKVPPQTLYKELVKIDENLAKQYQIEYDRGRISSSHYSLLRNPKQKCATEHLASQNPYSISVH